VDLRYHNHRFARELLESPTFAPHFAELEAVLGTLPALRRGHPPSLKLANDKNPIDQDAMNSHLDEQLKALGWDHHPGGIIAGTRLEADYNKARIQVEVQFGNMARWTYDVFKFQASYATNRIDIGILVVPMRWFAKAIGDNIAYFERIGRELPAAKLSITLPILVVGLDPKDDETLSPHRERYERESRLDEQWALFLEAWRIDFPAPIRRAELEELLFHPKYNEPRVMILKSLLPEDAREGIGESQKTFSDSFRKALRRRRAKRCIISKGGRDPFLQVIQDSEV